MVQTVIPQMRVNVVFGHITSLTGRHISPPLPRVRSEWTLLVVTDTGWGLIVARGLYIQIVSTVMTP